MPTSTWATHRCLSHLYLGAILAFAAISFLSVGILRLEYLTPARQELPAQVFGQLLGLHRILLHFFVLMPLIPTVFGYALLPVLLKIDELAFPRLALISWFLFVLGGLLMLLAFVAVGVEPGWAYAVVSPVTRELVSGEFLLGLFLACLSMQLTGVVFLATVHRGNVRTASLFCHSLYWTSWLVIIALSFLQFALCLAALEKIFLLGWFDAQTGGNPLFLALLSMWAATPMQVIVLLPVLGLACAIVQPEQILPAISIRCTKWSMAALTAFSFLAVDTRALPRTSSPLFVGVGSFYKALLTTTLFAIVGMLLRAAVRQHIFVQAERIYTAGAMLLILVLTPLDLFLSTPAAAMYASGYLGQAVYSLLFGGSCLLALLGGLHYWMRTQVGIASQGTMALYCTVVVFFGLVFAVLPVFLLGPSGLLMELTNYPVEFLPLQVLVLFGGAILTAGLIFAASELVVRSAVLFKLQFWH